MALFKCDPNLFSTMEYSKNYRQQFIVKIVDFGNTTKYEIIIMKIWNPTLKAQMKTINCSANDPCSDMDVDKTEEHKEQSISKQEQIDRKNIFLLFSQSSKYNNASQIYKQRNFHCLKENQTVFDHYKIFGKFAEDNKKSQSLSPKSLRISMSNISAHFISFEF